MKTSEAVIKNFVCDNGIPLTQPRKPGRPFVRHKHRLPNGELCRCSPKGDKD